ncbi:MAG: glycoside hydrolase family 88 protein [Clostridiales bacterium]|nr:glycoside hydrolase family 88 protein [Clostridiales bacterium]
MLYMINENKTWLESAWKKTEKKMKKVAVRSRGKIPYTAANGVHNNMAESCIDWWTNGFWSGLMWLMYSETHDDDFKETAVNGEKLLDKAFEKYELLHHDVGFMWHLSAGANYRLTGDLKARNKNLFAASILASRYNINASYIRAWNGRDVEGWSIIDCMMNIPLLYWASKELNDDNLKNIATAHADMALRDHIRDDGSVNHIVEHDVTTGNVVQIHGGQGYSKNSCWSRGAAWAVYGTILSYIHTQKQEYLDAAIKTADYFIENSKKTQYKVLVDFRQPSEPVYYDSTAGVCAACGLLEIAKYVPEDQAKNYTEAAINLLKATDENFCDYDENTDALVLCGTERYPLENMNGVHIPIIYGDFFYVEALLKLKGNDFLIW